MEEGDVFSDRDVLNANKVCMIGTTLKRELFDNESPVGKEMRISNVTFRVIGVLSSKGANMMGMDQDDIVVAPWTTIKYRVNAGLNNAGLSLSSARQRHQHVGQQPQQPLSSAGQPLRHSRRQPGGRHAAKHRLRHRRQPSRQGGFRRADSAKPSAKSRACSASGTTSTRPAKTTTLTTTSTSAT